LKTAVRVLDVHREAILLGLADLVEAEGLDQLLVADEGDLALIAVDGAVDHDGSRNGTVGGSVRVVLVDVAGELVAVRGRIRKDALIQAVAY